MPEEKKDSKPKKAVKKITKPSKTTKTVKVKAKVKVSKEAIIEPIATNEITEDTTSQDSIIEEGNSKEISC